MLQAARQSSSRTAARPAPVRPAQRALKRISKLAQVGTSAPRMTVTARA